LAEGVFAFLSLCKRFRVSHQLYGDSSHHQEIITAAVQYLRVNPERFIKSNLNRSWVEYLSNTSNEGTWADHSIIQAVADSLNLRTLTEATNSVIQNRWSAY